MEVKNNLDLSSYTYYKLAGGGDVTLYIVKEQHDLKHVPAESFVLGAGSNLLIVGKLDRPVVKLTSFNKVVTRPKDGSILVTAWGGMSWDNLVKWSLDNNLFGIENLSFIPGTVGASVRSNIGAYGVEVSEVTYLVKVWDIASHKSFVLNASECKFAYRDSTFKSHPEWIVVEVTYRLSAQFRPILTYRKLKDLEPQSLTARELRRIIGRLRKQALPDPKRYPNTGSFFVNPVVNRATFEKLYDKYQDSMPYYKLSDTEYKIPAGWLIDKAGLKGYTYGKAQVSPKNALVLVNLGDPTGWDVYNLARHVRDVVFKKFNILLTPEVQIIGERSTLD